ncbi:hypothetical protein E2562_039204 [Oryza meyeriana var. granulata]|uniref:Uncharacterized protein n=1 Tax=Oryza meyeriana var. granulata TaxID=110450 RepID=A0A6G1CXV9_9ORYZ|nr:hypothetical protein E2562_039204 [Oryza meyeriana var. granulata]
MMWGGCRGARGWWKWVGATDRTAERSGRRCLADIDATRRRAARHIFLSRAGHFLEHMLCVPREWEEEDNRLSASALARAWVAAAAKRARQEGVGGNHLR